MGGSCGNQESGGYHADSCWGATSVAGLAVKYGHGEDSGGDPASSFGVLK